MAEQVTKKDLKELAGTIVEAVDSRFKQMERQADLRFKQMERRMDLFDEKLDKLITTLDRFLKQLSDFKDEFTILKYEVDKIKNVLKEKLGVDISRR